MHLEIRLEILLLDWFCSEVSSRALNCATEFYTHFKDLISSCLLLSALTDEVGKRRYSRHMTPFGDELLQCMQDNLKEHCSPP